MGHRAREDYSADRQAWGEVLERHGRGPAARYRLRPMSRRFRIRGLQEDRAWREVSERIARVRPLAPDESRSL